MSLRSSLGYALNAALSPLNVQLVAGTSTDPAVKTFIPARNTIAAAKRAGLPLGTYIDNRWVEPGATGKVVSEMLELADLPQKVRAVCEIGPGSGRFVEEVTAALHPDVYEIYETARDWLPRLRTLPNTILRDCDGRSLRDTADASIDLVHAQKVFVYLRFYVVASYLEEMARVVRPGGVVAFDVATEPCLDEATVRSWVTDGTIYSPFPRTWAIGFMRRRGLSLLGSCFTPMPPGTAELLVFRRNADR
jgi:SAM-dependent methyltransferase